jgi:methylenetetrahydrofolate reductase (NADPH)
MTDYSPPVQSPLVLKLLNGETTFTVEISPPIAGSKKSLLDQAESLKSYIDAINVTDNAGASVAMSNMAASALLIANGHEVILQLNCRDQNRIGLMSDLLGAAALGINNIIAVRGDDPEAGDHPHAKPVFDLKSHELIRTAFEMTTNGIVPAHTMKIAPSGVQSNTKSIDEPPHFFIGAIDVPSLAGNEVWASRLHKKVASGIRFIQTQSCYDVEFVRRYLEILEDEGLAENLFITVSNSPLVSAQSAIWVKENIWGADIPDEVIARIREAKDPVEEGIRICTEQVKELVEMPGVAGINLIERQNAESISAVLQEIGAENG